MKKLTISKAYRNYLQILSGIFGMTNREIDLLVHMHEIPNTTDIKKHRELLASNMGISKKTIGIMFVTMNKKKIINIPSHGKYEIHPLLEDIQDLEIEFKDNE
jgi:hypothetical protein